MIGVDRALRTFCGLHLEAKRTLSVPVEHMIPLVSVLSVAVAIFYSTDKVCESLNGIREAIADRRMP